ncbi:MAG: galactose oxidase early set domain-containing protein [Calothrix sp. MO_167.B42]|nr:galactose oxidase early set domain-containing protein [Calothrix sp. MO_167.B42]
MSQALPPINVSSPQDFQESPKVNKNHKSKTFKLRSLIVSNFIIFFLAFTLIFCGVKPAFAAVNAPDCVGTNPEELGCWQKYPLFRDEEGKILPLESVHTSVLPNGKILMVNGSSNRNTIDRQTDGDGNDLKITFIDGVKTSKEGVVDNTAIFDPVTGTFEKISSPPAVQFGDSNDLFCTGHLHLPNGNVFFAGGSNRYYPGEQFEGSKQINIYNWKFHTWDNIGGKMKAGRWYPSLVPLADGKVVIFSGQKYDAPSQITPTIEIYDPTTNELHFFDLTYVEDSPFNVKIKQYNYIDADGNPGIGEADIYDSIDLYPRVFPTADGKLLITGDGAGKFPLEVHKSDRTYLMSVTEEASDTQEIPGKPCVKEASGKKLCISFEVGNDRKDISKVYGTAVADPNREGDILLLGGLLNNNNINFGKPQLGKIVDGQAPAGSTNEKLLNGDTRIAASLERWDSKADEWSIVPNFLHTDDGNPQPRAMDEAVILPNKEILTVNGGRYAEYAPIYEPLLMTYDPDSPGGYKTKEMNPATLPRLYHNGALLLPDARVLTISGNASRAARKPNGTVHVDVVPDNKEYYALAKLTTTPDVPGSGKVISKKDYNQFLEDYYQSPQKYFAQLDDSSIDPLPFVPAEIWQMEIFNPPYLFKAGPRPEIETVSQTLKHGEAGTVTVKNIDISSDSEKGSLAMVKLGTITHSFDYGQRLADLPIQNVTDNGDGSYTMDFTAPENANLYTPGYYMMFYLNSNGKPSVAKMVQLEAA